MDNPELKKVPARCGCEGCYFDTHSGCEVEEHMQGVQFPPKELWPCSDEIRSYIFVPIKEAE